MTSEATEFKVGEVAYFRRPCGLDVFPEDSDRLRTYIDAATRGPFYVVAVTDVSSDSESSHPQRITLGDTPDEALLVQFGNDPVEEFEVSGYWLAKE